MGLIANQMVIEMLYKVSQAIQNKKEQKKNSSKTVEAEKKHDKEQ